MKMLEYAAPQSLAEGVNTLAGNRRDAVRPLAGGTDLLPLMKASIESPRVLMNVKRMRDLSREIVVDDDGALLGALASLADIARHPGIARYYPALSQAALSAATPQLRNMATIGGTLLQRPRCWYFRNAQFRCWLKGGDECNARQGQNQFHAIFETGICRAVHPSDLACALALLDAEVRVQGAGRARAIALTEFIVPPSDDHRTETTLGHDELVLSVRVPPPAPGTRSVYLKAMDRAVWAFATVSVAAAMRHEGDTITDVAVVLGGVATVPWRITEAMQCLVGAAPRESAFAAAARAALADAQPLRMNAYKTRLAQALIRQALRSLSISA